MEEGALRRERRVGADPHVALSSDGRLYGASLLVDALQLSFQLFIGDGRLVGQGVGSSEIFSDLDVEPDTDMNDENPSG